MTGGAFFSRLGFSVLAALLGVLFALPLIWFFFAPFNARAEMGLALPDPWTLNNFGTVFQNSFAVRALLNSLMRSGDKVLIKGSRGVAMETIVAALQQRPEQGLGVSS